MVFELMSTGRTKDLYSVLKVGGGGGRTGPGEGSRHCSIKMTWPLQTKKAGSRLGRRWRRETDLTRAFPTPNPPSSPHPPIPKVEADIEKRKAGGEGLGPFEVSLEERQHEAHMEHLRSRADELFAMMDANGNGYVDRWGFSVRHWGFEERLEGALPEARAGRQAAGAWPQRPADEPHPHPIPPPPQPTPPTTSHPPREEFILAMNMLRDELGWDEAELGTVFNAIDCHGHVSREQVGGLAGGRWDGGRLRAQGAGRRGGAPAIGPLASAGRRAGGLSAASRSRPVTPPPNPNPPPPTPLSHQFQDILIAEELRDPAADAEVLRRMVRSQQAKGWHATHTWEGSLTV
jgi:hypothetical protein